MFDSGVIVGGRQADGGTRQRTSGSIGLPRHFRRSSGIETGGTFNERPSCTGPHVKLGTVTAAHEQVKQGTPVMTRPGPHPSAPHEVDFQHIPTGGYFAECTQLNRAAAEAFAFNKLISLGEDLNEASEAVKLAGYTGRRRPHLRRPHLLHLQIVPG